MKILSILKKDLCDKRITDIVGKDIYMLHKPESEKADLYIEYEVIENKESSYAGNTNLGETTFIQVDIFAKGSFVELAKAVKKVLKEKGYFYYRSANLYEEETALFHWASRWYKETNNEEE